MGMKSGPGTKHNHYLLLILVGLCLFSNVGGIAAYFRSVYELVWQEDRLQVKATGELFRDEIVRRLENRATMVRFLAETPILALYFQQPQESKLYLAEAYLDYYADNLGGAVCYLLDGEGVVVASSNRYAPDGFVGKNYAASPYFRAAIEGTPGVFLGEEGGDGQRGVYLSHPVTGEGTILGVAVIKFPVAIFEERFAKVGGIMALLNPEGVVFAANRQGLPGKKLQTRPVSPWQFPGLAAHKGEGTPPATTDETWLTTVQEGVRFLGMRFELRGLGGWELVYLYDDSDVLRRVWQGVLTPTGYALMAMMLAIFLGTMLLYYRATLEFRQRAAAERKAMQANAVLSQIFNVAADGIRIIDHDFNVVKANETFAALTGRPLAEIIGKKCYEVFPGTSCNTPLCPKVQIIDQGVTQVRQDVRKQTAQGTTVTCQVVGVPFRDAHGKVVGTLECYRDISEHIEAERALEEAFAQAHKLAEEVAASHDKMQTQKAQLEEAYHRLQESQAQLLQREKMASIGQLAAGVAHEINNPMGFISSNLGTMAKYMERLTEFIAAQGKSMAGCCGEGPEVAELAEQRKRLKIDYVINDVGNLVKESLDGAERVRKIVQGLKSFSRLDQAEVQAANLNECLETTINIVWNELKYKAEVKREYGELPPTVCNPQQLNQVFMNLLVNAAQSIEKQGTIIVKTWADATWVSVAVSDSGCGIPAEQLSHVFEPFYTTKEVGKGTGLGLSIAYDIVVKKHKGTIEVASEVGKGTTFTVRIPLVTTTKPAS